nr:fibronectin type III domain-containing protein [uncultured Sellimonas sp.]
MNKVGKKVLSFGLAVSLLAGSIFPAVTTRAAGKEKKGNTYSGAIELSLLSALDLKSDTPFKVKLDGEADDEKEVVLKAGNGETLNRESVRFENLKEGTYTLSIEAGGFVPYRQDILVENLEYHIQVLTDETESFDFSDSAKHPGVIRIGDVNGDGTVDEKDQDALVDVLDGQKEKDGYEYDLNKDGHTDLIDLQYLAAHINKIDQVSATIETKVPVSEIGMEAEGGTVQNGELEDLLSGTEDSAVQIVSEDKISEENPVELNFEFGKGENPVDLEGALIKTPQGSENQITEGTIIVWYVENGKEVSQEIPIQKEIGKQTRSAGPQAVLREDGTIEVNFNGQIAVKKVTIKITATSNAGNIAEISSVEFVNDMENRIPKPDMDIPEGLSVKPGDKEFTVSWKKAKNVTGYEVKIEADGKTEIQKTSQTSLTVKSFKNEKLINNKEYKVQVQSVNGDWRSGYCNPVTAVPKPSKKPAAPDNLKVTGKYKSLELSWKKMEDTDSYNIYYREDGAEQYEKIEQIKENQYKIENLKDNVKYYVYITGVNELGEGPASVESSAKTTNIVAAKLPAYELINASKGEGELTDHIQSAQLGRGYMVDSPLDEGKDEKSALGVVDNDYTSYLRVDDWDEGGAYPANNKGVTVTFDERYEIGTIALAEVDDSIGWYSHVNIKYWDEQGKQQSVGASIKQKQSDNGRKYYYIKLSEPVVTDKIKVGIGRPYGNMRPVVISEMRFYKYNSIEHDIMALYEDDMHTTLKPEVTEQTIEELQERLDKKDPVSGEYHPEKEMLEKELKTAKDILLSNSFETVSVNPNITPKKDGHLGITGLNAWQPLGITAYAGEEIEIYVGHPNKKTGDTTDLQLIATQNHAESSDLMKVVANLKIGKNEIVIPNLQSLDFEHGGALYIQYTGNNSADKYGVRVDGGVKLPILNLYKAGEDKQEKIQAYVEGLEQYVSTLKETHDKIHKESNQEAVSYEYDEKNCILNTTDIMLDQMMLTLPATQVLSGLGKGTIEEKAERLEKSMQSMNDMMALFYHNKGLTNENGADASDRMPSQHLNIRYMRMFAGAFMYAGGNHIGIEWTETPSLVKGEPIKTDENGKLVSGQYFGWGIAHEIGHNINQSQYAVAEVTNNFFSVLAQADETNSGVRFKYEDVYKKVTSNTIGRDSNVFTQLGLYWQLHLAYDRGYNFKMYDTHEEQLSNLFFARVDSYARNVKKAPAPDGVLLTLGSDKDQNIMRLASAAAQKNLLEFFERWGMEPDETTKQYVQQFPAEERAIYYVNDEARAYEIEHGTAGTLKGADIVTVQTEVKESDPNRVELTLTADEKYSDVLLGYEITRCTTEKGKTVKEVVGFTTDNHYTDVISSLSNRVVTYEVSAVDKFLNRSAVKQTDSIKIHGDGSQDKSEWTINTNMISEEDKENEADINDPCEPEKISASVKMIDNDKKTVYKGTSEEKDPEIVLSMNKLTEVTAVKYTAPETGTAIKDYEIQISQDGKNYQTVKTGTFQLEDQTETVYFQNENQDPWVCTYDVSYVKIIAKGQKGTELSISEIDILGPSGDNVEFMDQTGETSIGKLKEDYIYEASTGKKIPKGSIVFMGTYKGNPAYNVVLLYDENGNIVGGTDEEGNILADQIIMADVPEHGELGETSKGTWVYWIEPDVAAKLPKKVRAELYRVDNALDNSGERLVSDTLMVNVPEQLSDIEIQ